MKTSGAGALLIFGTFSCLGQTGHEPYTFFKEFIGLDGDQITDIRNGYAVAKVLSTETPSEVAVFGAVYIHASCEDYVNAAKNLTILRGSPDYMGVQAFSTPPELSDLHGFILEDDDIKALKSCTPGSCELQLPVASIEEFRVLVNWSGPDVAAQVNGLAQEMALAELVRYQKNGNSALGSYFDKAAPVHVIERFESLLRESSSVSHYLPDLERYLIGYPREQLPSAESFSYWERVEFGLKPTLRMNNMVIYRGSGPSGPVDSVAIKQLFASHYFQTALDLSVCAQDSSRPGEQGFYLITVKGSRQAGLTGPRGSIIRKTAVSRTRSSLEKSLKHVKTVLESSREKGHAMRGEGGVMEPLAINNNTLKGGQSWHN